MLTNSVTVFGPPGFVVGGLPGVYDGGAPNQILSSFMGEPLFGDGLGPAGTGLDANNSINTVPAIQNLAGPPAWPAFNDGTFPPGFLGYPEGMVANGLLDIQGPDGCDDFPVVAGPYEMDVTIPTSPAGSQPTDVLKSTASLVSTTPLPNFPVPSFSSDGQGGGTISVNVPAGVSEAFVNVKVTNQACFPLQAQVNGNNYVATPSSLYTLMSRATGPQTLVLPDNLGPPTQSGARLHTMCTAADNAAIPIGGGGQGRTPGAATLTVTAVGVDYPAYEASYPQSATPTPVLTGANGQADVTQSPQTPLFSE
ncbi:MAG: hypothetical protein NVS9B12_01970 [Vulcanimicrobiaceae bacterium]